MIKDPMINLLKLRSYETAGRLVQSIYSEIDTLVPNVQEVYSESPFSLLEEAAANNFQEIYTAALDGNTEKVDETFSKTLDIFSELVLKEAGISPKTEHAEQVVYNLREVLADEIIEDLYSDMDPALMQAVQQSTANLVTPIADMGIRKIGGVMHKNNLKRKAKKTKLARYGGKLGKKLATRRAFKRDEKKNRYNPYRPGERLSSQVSPIIGNVAGALAASKLAE